MPALYNRRYPAHRTDQGYTGVGSGRKVSGYGPYTNLLAALKKRQTVEAGDGPTKTREAP